LTHLLVYFFSYKLDDISVTVNKAFRRQFLFLLSSYSIAANQVTK